MSLYPGFHSGCLHHLLFDPGAAESRRPFCQGQPGGRPGPAPGPGLAGHPYRHCHCHGCSPAGSRSLEKLAGFRAGRHDRREFYPFSPGRPNDHGAAPSALAASPGRGATASPPWPWPVSPWLSLPWSLLPASRPSRRSWLLRALIGRKKAAIFALLLFIMALNLLALLNVRLILQYISPAILLVLGWVMAVLQAALAVQYLFNALVRAGVLQALQFLRRDGQLEPAGCLWAGGRGWSNSE